MGSAESDSETPRGVWEHDREKTGGSRRESPLLSGAERSSGSGGEREGTWAGRGIARAVLLGLGTVQLINGLWALLAPSSFYGEFPVGRGWVALMPPYNEHLTVDVGGLYLATSALLIGAAWSATRQIVLVACVAWLCFSFPHAVYHLFNLGTFGTADATANVVVLVGTVALPLLVLRLAVRRGDGDRTRGRPAPVTYGDRARIEGVGDDTRNVLVRASYRESRRRFGEVMEPVRVFAHHPRLMLGYSALELASEHSKLVPARLKHLAELRAAMICGCEWCLDFGSSISDEAGVDERDLQALLDYEQSDRFTSLERLAMRYADAVSRSPVEVSDDLFAELAEHLEEAELVELTSIIALENYRARFNWAFGIAGQGFSEGSFCVPPETRRNGALPEH